MAGPTLIEILNKTVEHLKQKGIETHLLDAQLLLGEVMKLDRVGVYLNYDRPLTEKELEACRNLVRRRASREPLQHILGKVHFRDLIFKVDKRALIPRRETELIVDAVKEAVDILHSSSNRDTPLSILEVGVGTGVIFLSLKKELEGVDVYGVELEPEALTLALENASLNNVAGSEFLKQGDTFSPFPPDQTWDIIVSNPPYVAIPEFEHLEPEVRFWDPPQALIGGNTGMEYPGRLMKEAFNRVSVPGYLIMEIGDGQEQELKRKAKSYGWNKISLKQDYSMKNRFLILGR